MKILKKSVGEAWTQSEQIAACIGYFDGLHIGHMGLVRNVVQLAAQTGLTPALITFDPDPWVTLRGMHDVPHLTSMSDRQRLAEKAGIQMFIILDFTEAMAQLEVDAFHAMLSQMHVRHLVCGHDFHYGRYGAGSPRTLMEQQDFAISVIEPITFDGVRISSSRIEQLIKEGEVEMASRLLGRFYFIRGKVAHGYQRGRRMRFPTANLQLEDAYLLPGKGVYAGSVEVEGKRWPAMINVGQNPTFANDALSIEANIFDFEDNIYGMPVVFRFIRFIREEKRFDSGEELIWQLKSDREAVRALFERHPQWLKED